MKTYQRSLLILGITSLAFVTLFISLSGAQNRKSTSATKAAPITKEEANKKLSYDAKWRSLRKAQLPEKFEPTFSSPVGFIETIALRDAKAEPAKGREGRAGRNQEDHGKNPRNPDRVKPAPDPSMDGPFIDPTLRAESKGKGRDMHTNAVSAPIANFDGPDMDAGAVIFGGRFAPPDTNAAVGPNHVMVTTNGGLRVYDKAGAPLTAQIRMSAFLVGIANAADDDGDPIVLYDQLADRWLVSQFNLRFTGNQMHQHIAISKTGDPTGAYYAYDFLLAPGRFVDYPHFGVWPNGYYMSANDFTPPGVAPFLGASLYSFERAKMLTGDPTAKVIIFTTNNLHGGMLPTNLQGYTAPPANTPNIFIEFDATEFGAATDLIRPFEFTPNYTTPLSSTLVQLADIPTAPFDARQSTIAQPAPGEALDAIADRLMHAMNFRILPGGVQSTVLNFTVNVSGVAPVSAATYQAGVRWMELRRNPGTGAITINQDATYAPGSGAPTGRDLWMAAIAQDGEGNIGLGASASSLTPALIPTAIYTGRLAGDPANTLPQGEVDAMTATVRGVQTATSGRWGDYSSLFVDPSDDCTFWGAFEWVDPPSSSFDWNTRVFSFKVNPTCVTPAKGTLVFNVTDCASGLPIENASITLNGNPQGATLASGSSSSILPPGAYNYSVTKTNYSVVNGATSVTNGNTTTVNLCLVGVPAIAAAGSTITAESCVPADNALSPNETVTMNFGLKNNGTAATTSLVATLQATGGVTSPSGPQNYGAIPPDNTTVVNRPFTFTVDPAKLCGDTVTATFNLQDGALNLGTVTFTLQVGAPGGSTQASYSSGNIAVPIPDVATVDVPITVPDTGQVQDVNVRIRLNHTFDGDLVIQLVHPDGTIVNLANNRGGAGANYGTGANDCSGTPTIFDDAAAATIASGVAPFAGTFKPETVLSALNGKPSNGTWKLRVSDTAALDVGTIGCATIQITRAPFVCCGVAGTPNITAGPAILVNESCPPPNNAIDPGERVTVNLSLTNGGTGATTNLVATLQSTGGVTSPSAPQSYGVLTATGPGATATRDFSFTAVGSCGGTITATWQLQDGATNLGTVTKTFTLGGTVNNTQTFANPGSILIPAGAPTTTSGIAAPYPSTINVAGVVGAVSKVTVTLKNMNHTFPDDIDVLLVGPGGQKILLMSDAGGAVATPLPRSPWLQNPGHQRWHARRAREAFAVVQVAQSFQIIFNCCNAQY